LEEIVPAVWYRPVSPPTVKEQGLVVCGMKANGHPLAVIEHFFNAAYSVALCVVTQLAECELSIQEDKPHRVGGFCHGIRPYELSIAARTSADILFEAGLLRPIWVIVFRVSTWSFRRSTGTRIVSIPEGGRPRRRFFSSLNGINSLSTLYGVEFTIILCAIKYILGGAD
jgi:hypothetical protein